MVFRERLQSLRLQNKDEEKTCPRIATYLEVTHKPAASRRSHGGGELRTGEEEESS
jgi:hypothetical protein